MYYVFVIIYCLLLTKIARMARMARMRRMGRMATFCWCEVGQVLFRRGGPQNRWVSQAFVFQRVWLKEEVDK